MSVIKVILGRQGDRGVSGTAAPETIAVNAALTSVVNVSNNIDAVNTVADNIVDITTVANSIVAIVRSIPLNVIDFGAIGDGIAHPLSLDFATLAEAQVVYPQATALTDELDGTALRKCIAYCVTYNRNTIYTPTSSDSSGYFRFNTFIDFPFTLFAREGFINFIGDTGSATRSYNATWVRTTSAAGFRFIGSSLNVGNGNHLIRRINLKSICINGGWANPGFNTNADYPVILGESGYEFFWDDAVITQALGGVHLTEVMDSRFNNIRITWCGQQSGYQKDMAMTSGSAVVTVDSTTGIRKGQRVFGSGIQSVRVLSVDSSTAMTLTKNMTYTGTRPTSFEAKAALTIDSTDSVNATSNNQIWTGFRIENCAGCGIRMYGKNIIDLFASDGKIEGNGYALDYLIDIELANGVFLDKMWLYSAPLNFDNMEWAVTTAGKVLSADTMDTFTLDVFHTDTGTLTTGSKIVTGLADTSSLTVGQFISGTGITASSLQGVCVASIDSPTQITITDNAVSTGALALTFEYPYNSGIFYRRGFFTHMPVICYDTEDPRNYQFCRVVKFNVTTGVVDLHVLNTFGDLTKSITSWKVAVAHAGMAYFNGVTTFKGVFEGGYPTGSAAPGVYPYLHSFIHLEDCTNYIGEGFQNAGIDMLPNNTFKALTSATSITIGLGDKSFTTLTGLPDDYYIQGEEIYINGSTLSTVHNHMVGVVKSYDDITGVLVVTVQSVLGFGTYSDWKISRDLQPMHLQTGANLRVSMVELADEFGLPACFKQVGPLNSSFKDTVNEFTRQQYHKEKVLQLIDSVSEISWNLDTGQTAIVTLIANRILENPTNMRAGSTYSILVKQDASGGRTLTYESDYKWFGGVAPTLSVGANAVDLLIFYCDGVSMHGTILKNSL